MNRRSRRFIFFGIMILAGIAAGLLYGWVINPVPITSIKPHDLRIDYRTDFVLMVAELYHQDDDLAQAVTRLTYLGETPLNTTLDETLAYAEENAYAPRDIDYMENLASAIELILPGEE